MRHFTTIVILPKDVEVKAQSRKGENVLDRILSGLLAPYDENTTVPEYDKECFCVGNKAREAWTEDPTLNGEALDVARKRLNAENEADIKRRDAIEWGGTKEANDAEFDTLEAKIYAAWQALTKPIFERRDELEKAHPFYGKPDPKCEECHGSGIEKSTYNPKSKWDWWVIGGRWTGLFDGYKPAKDPRNWERCRICEGTGVRASSGLRNGKPWCNACTPDMERHGLPVGMCVSWSYQPHEGDVARVGSLLEKEKPPMPFAIVTPDGEWHEKGRMGCWAMVSDEKDKKDWHAEVLDLYKKYEGHVAVLCDLHI